MIENSKCYFLMWISVPTPDSELAGTYSNRMTVSMKRTLIRARTVSSVWANSSNPSNEFWEKSSDDMSPSFCFKHSSASCILVVIFILLIMDSHMKAADSIKKEVWDIIQTIFGRKKIPFLVCCLGWITKHSPLISTELFSLSKADHGTETDTSEMDPSRNSMGKPCSSLRSFNA